jgi:CRP/FNR family transcriptional regulator
VGAIAGSTVDMLLFPAPAFRRWMSESPALRAFVFDAFADRLLDLLGLVQSVAFQGMDSRLAACLVDASLAAGTKVVELTHEQLAAQLGSAREVVSRRLKMIERAGVISRGRGRIQVLDMPRLKSIAMERHNVDVHPNSAAIGPLEAE